MISFASTHPAIPNQSKLHGADRSLTLWETGAAQSAAAGLTAEHVDWQSRTITYFRAKTGSRAQFTIHKFIFRRTSRVPRLKPNLQLPRQTAP